MAVLTLGVKRKAPGAALLTGIAMGEDVGYGPARLHDAKETAEFARFLEAVDPAQLRARAATARMSRLGIYQLGGARAGVDPDDSLRDEVGLYFPFLRDYVAKAAERGYGLLVWIS
jgi:hypothetical protein